MQNLSLKALSSAPFAPGVGVTAAPALSESAGGGGGGGGTGVDVALMVKMDCYGSWTMDRCSSPIDSVVRDEKFC